MQAKLKSGIILKRFINTIKDFITEINFNIDNKGLNIQGIEDTNIALANLNLDYRIFDEFTVSKNMNFDISLLHFVKVFKSFEEDDTILISTSDKLNTLNFIFQNLEGDTTSSFTIPMINSEYKMTQQRPNLSYNNAIVMASSEMSKICGELKNLAKIIEIDIDVDKENIKFNVDKRDIKEHGGIEYIEGGYVQLGTKNKQTNTKLYVIIIN